MIYIYYLYYLIGSLFDYYALYLIHQYLIHLIEPSLDKYFVLNFDFELKADLYIVFVV